MFFMRSQHLLHHLWLPAQLQGAGSLSLQVLRPHQPSWRSTFNSLHASLAIDNQSKSPNTKPVNWTLKSLNFSAKSRLFSRKSNFTASILSMRIRPQDRAFLIPVLGLADSCRDPLVNYLVHISTQSVPLSHVHSFIPSPTSSLPSSFVCQAR